MRGEDSAGEGGGEPNSRRQVTWTAGFDGEDKDHLIFRTQCCNI